MDLVQRYICAHVGGMDEVSSQLLGVHDTHSCSYYEEIQDFLDRKHQLEHKQQRQQLQTVNVQSSERVLIRGLDEFLNELDPSLFVKSESAGPPRLAVANLLVHSSYIRQKQEEAMLTRLWSKYSAVETERRTVAPISWGGPIKRQRVV
uniref:Uncharacterized protein n=1 Tax=Hyaloperonospora arabidopsidis (strain Emoy2) TaxID=559515 RepID=M4BAM4_HYAAE